MIKINLLPEEFKKGQGPKASFKFEIPKFGPKALKTAYVFLAILIGVHLLLALSIFLKGNSLKRLEERWRLIQPREAEVDALNSSLAAVERVVQPIRALVESRLIWAQKLNQLSDLMTPGIWLKGLSIDTQITDPQNQKGEQVRILNLEGYAASMYGDETALIGKFIKALQEDKGFFRHFTEVKLGPMEKEGIEKTQVMHFIIYCFFKRD